MDGEDGALTDGMELRDHSLPETNRRTRFGGKKHVPVYGVRLNSNIRKTEKNKGILKNTTYKIHQNFIPEQLKALDKNCFYSRKQALHIHSEVCDISQCPICACADAVSYLSYNPGNHSRYIFQEYPQQSIKPEKSLKTVTFAKNAKFQQEQSFRQMYLKRKMVEKACLHCISLVEAGLLERN